MKKSLISHKLAGRTLTYLILVLFFFISVLPIWWIWQAALVPKSPTNIDPFAIPTSLTLDNVVAAWTVGKMSSYMVNSLLVAVPRVAVVLLLSSLAGYAFGKLKFFGRNKIFSFILFGMMIPVQAMAIPLYYNIQRLGMIDNRWTLILPYYGLSMTFEIFMMR